MAPDNPDPRNRSQPSVPRDPAEGNAQHADVPSLSVQAQESLLDIARRLLEYEAAQLQGSGEPAEPSERLFAKLRAQMDSTTGVTSYRFLVVRAATMARMSDRVTVDEQGNVKVVVSPGSGPSNTDSIAATLASLFELLDSIIGHGMLLRLIRRAWPGFVLAPPNSSSQEIRR